MFGRGQFLINPLVQKWNPPTFSPLIFPISQVPSQITLQVCYPSHRTPNGVPNHPPPHPDSFRNRVIQHPASPNHISPPGIRTRNHPLLSSDMDQYTPYPPPGTKNSDPRPRKLIVDTTTVRGCICPGCEHPDYLFHLYGGKARKRGKVGIAKLKCLGHCSVLLW